MSGLDLRLPFTVLAWSSTIEGCSWNFNFRAADQASIGGVPTLQKSFSSGKGLADRLPHRIANWAVSSPRFLQDKICRMALRNFG